MYCKNDIIGRGMK